MALHEYLAKYRKKLGLSKTEMARKLHVTYAYYIRLEQPFHIGRALPSVELLKKIARLVAQNDKELEKKVFKELLQARYIQRYPKEIQLELKELPAMEFTNSMPQAFIERLKEDIEYPSGLTRAAYKSGIPEEILKAVIEGKYVLNRDSVVVLARMLNQSVEEYLALAQYVPEKIDITDRKLAAFFRLLGKLPDDTLQKIVDVVTVLSKPPQKSPPEER